jgi:flagellar biosynthesis protein FlhF
MLTAVREELDILQGLLDDLNDPDAPPAKAMGASPTAGRTDAARSAAADFLREEPDAGERRVDLTATGEALRRTLQEAVLPPRRDVMSQGGVVALVGPTGVGKTTTVAKLAARYALRHGYDQVALVTTDSYRIAAHEQLRTYARILGIPVRVANDENELRTTLDNLADRSLVLIDTAGMSQRDRRLAEQFRTLVAGAPAVQTYAVLAANTQAATLDEVVGAFQGAELDGCVLTKLDECTSLGGILSTIMERHLPLAFFSDGQRVPEDIYPATPELIAERVEALASGGDPDGSSLSATGGSY